MQEFDFVEFSVQNICFWRAGAFMLLSDFYANAHSDDTLNKRSSKTHEVLSPAAHSSHSVPISYYFTSSLFSTKKYAIYCVIYPFKDHYQACSAVIINNKFTESVLIFNLTFAFLYLKVNNFSSLDIFIVFFCKKSSKNYEICY